MQHKITPRDVRSVHQHKIFYTGANRVAKGIPSKGDALPGQAGTFQQVHIEIDGNICK